MDNLLFNKKDVGESLIQQLMKQIDELQGDVNLVYIYFEHMQRVEDHKKILVQRNQYENLINTTIDIFCVAIQEVIVSIVRFDNANPNVKDILIDGLLVEDIQNYKYGNRYNGYSAVLENLKTLTNSNEKLETIHILKDSLDKVYKKQLKDNDSYCYIATMAYQDINHPQVEYLRQVRDKKLLQHPLGQIFVKYYYKYSPQLVEFFKDYKMLNKGIRGMLDGLIFLLKKHE